jgi:DNA-binding PadR family transcriptional regulator
MATTESRLLVLGAVAMFSPINGYQIRRELTSWGVDDWAHLNPGSIYSVLATLTRHGHLARHDLPEGSRTVAVYTVTDAGRRELDRLFVGAMTTVDMMAPLAFNTAVLMAPLTERARFTELLELRLAALGAELLALSDPAPSLSTSVQSAPVQSAPPQVSRSLRLWRRIAEVERDWIVETLTEVDAGGLYFLGEDQTWVPPSDDPGWQILRERERYLRLLQT